MNYEFENIEVKQNSLKLLKRELLKIQFAMIGTEAIIDHSPLKN
jgi:hypothetical protein